jgi:7,8-dihydropterin-6-yl-methyl-4-(beta-D-ribofuranosyl)aminobenzene 5'-phosphate synthase
MICRRKIVLGAAATLLSPLPGLAQAQPARVTILYDAFGKPSALKRGWGYLLAHQQGSTRRIIQS